jgi:hypothetical protein
MWTATADPIWWWGNFRSAAAPPRPFPFGETLPNGNHDLQTRNDTDSDESKSPFREANYGFFHD